MFELLSTANELFANEETGDGYASRFASNAVGYSPLLFSL
jgi:hypothetical protein